MREKELLKELFKVVKRVAVVEKKTCWILRQWPKEKLYSSGVVWRRPSGEAVEYCFWKRYWRALVEVKRLSRLTVGSCQWRLK